MYVSPVAYMVKDGMCVTENVIGCRGCRRRSGEFPITCCARITTKDEVALVA